MTLEIKLTYTHHPACFSTKEYRNIYKSKHQLTTTIYEISQSLRGLKKTGQSWPPMKKWPSKLQSWHPMIIAMYSSWYKLKTQGVLIVL
jgi:hypothetical protein